MRDCSQIRSPQDKLTERADNNRAALYYQRLNMLLYSS